MRRIKNAILTVILILMLAACSQAAPEPGQPELSPTPPAEDAGAAADAIAAARAELAERLGVAAAELVLVSSDEMEWPDACLGSAAADEMCAQVVTPGWLVVLRAPGAELLYEVRTDETGSIVRMQQTVDGGQELPVAALRAREELAAELGIGLEMVEVVSFTEEEWPDSCLGLPEDGELCAQVITLGWRVELEAEGQRYEARTTAEGDVVRIGDAGADEGGDLGGAAVVFTQSGGIAGIHTVYRIYPSGMMEKESGQAGAGEGVSAIETDAAAVAQLLADLERLGFFALDSSDEGEIPCCDFFVYELAAQAGEQSASLTVVETGDNQSAPEWQYVELVRAFIEAHEAGPTG